MKHFISLLSLALALASAAYPQNCDVPITVFTKNNSSNNDKNYPDQSLANLSNLLVRHGFSTDMNHTCVAICLVSSLDNEPCDNFNEKMIVHINFINFYSGSTLYSAKLDKYYCGNPYQRNAQLAADLADSSPQLDSLADYLHSCVVNAFELNSSHVARVARDFAVQGEHVISLFTLAQFPSCCPSFPKIQNIMAALFRDYMNRDHDALLNVAVRVLRNNKNETNARFVVSLLNSVKLSDKEQKKADGILLTIANQYPSLDLKADLDYLFDPELKNIAIREARSIGIDYSNSKSILDDSASTKSSANFMKSLKNHDDNNDWYPETIRFFDSRVEQRQFKGAGESWWK